MKEVGLGAIIQRGLREQFPEAPKAEDIPAAAVLREYMQEYAARHASCASKAQEKPIDAIPRYAGISRAL